MRAGGSGGVLRRSSRADSPNICRSGLWGQKSQGDRENMCVCVSVTHPQEKLDPTNGQRIKQSLGCVSKR